MFLKNLNCSQIDAKSYENDSKIKYLYTPSQIKKKEKQNANVPAWFKLGLKPNNIIAGKYTKKKLR